MTPDLHEFGIQAVKALGYYATLLVMMRLAGKRLAGQTTTFDLLVLITLGVTVQGVFVTEGPWNMVVFVVVVFAAHRGLASICRLSPTVRHFVRGRPRALVRDGHVIEAALDAEGVSHDELLAGLRRLGFEDPAEVRLAVLEETGHISAVGASRPGELDRDDAQG